MGTPTKAVCHAVFLVAVSWNIPLAAQPLDLGRSSVAQAEEPALHTPDSHGRDPLVANSAWFREFKRDVSSEPADPHSDQMLARLRKAKGTIDAQWSGSWTPSDWNWYTWPFQVVRGDVAPLTIPGTWAYNPASKGPYILPPEPVVYENRRETTYATAKWTDGADHHLCIYVRDEASGGYKELWEYYQPWVTRSGKQVTAVAGASWRKFDLLHGEVPAAGVPATDAAGLIIMPLVVRYDEVARGSINHALRFCVNNSDISPTFKWPARTAAARGTPQRECLMARDSASKHPGGRPAPMPSLAPTPKPGSLARRFAATVSSWRMAPAVLRSSFKGWPTWRWEKTLVSRLNAIPVTALEVVLTPPLLQIAGPTNLQVGQVGTWTMTFLPKESPVGEGSTINIWDQNNKQIQYRWAIIDEAHRTVSAQRSFSQPGVYSIRPYAEWNLGFGPYRITVSPVPTQTKPSTSPPQRQ